MIRTDNNCTWCVKSYICCTNSCIEKNVGNCNQMKVQEFAKQMQDFTHKMQDFTHKIQVHTVLNIRMVLTGTKCYIYIH